MYTKDVREIQFAFDDKTYTQKNVRITGMKLEDKKKTLIINLEDVKQDG